MGMERGDADFSMDGWIGNLLEVWEKVTGNGKMVSLGANFPDAPQGWYVPTYMIRGDKKRGIRPVAPDLKSAADLPGYKELFRDPAAPGSGPICLAYSSSAGTFPKRFPARQSLPPRHSSLKVISSVF